MHKLPSPAEAFANAYRALRAAGKSVEHSERIAWAASSMARARALGACAARKDYLVAQKSPGIEDDLGVLRAFSDAGIDPRG